MSVFGVFPVRIFSHSDWIQRFALRIQSEYWKIRTRKNPNTDTFYAVIVIDIEICLVWKELSLHKIKIYVNVSKWNSFSFVFSTIRTQQWILKPKLLSCRNQSVDSDCELTACFLYGGNFGLKWVIDNCL